MFSNENKKYGSCDEINISSPESSPMFLVLNENNNNIEEYKSCFEGTYDNFESKLEKGENKYEILIKFSNFGLYKITLLIKYHIKHEITWDII